MAEKQNSFDTKGLFENIEKFVEEAESGNYDAIQRLNAIKKLANPIFDFSASHYRRVLDKKLSLPVTKGIQLYKMMSQIAILVQPIGKRKGAACTVRRVDYENLTWEAFIELRGNFSGGFVMEAIKQRAKPQFEGMNMLNERQKELYERIKVYFGNNKKPTLQSLAMNILSEDTDGKDFSERSLYIYLDAVKKYQVRRKKAAGFDVLYFTFSSVTSFNTGKTIRESIESWDETMNAASVRLKEVSVNLMKDILPDYSKSLMLQFQTPRFTELIGSIFSNISDYQDLPKKE
jgi:hypothetical protein